MRLKQLLREAPKTKFNVQLVLDFDKQGMVNRHKTLGDYQKDQPFPDEVQGDFACEDLFLTSLKGGPRMVRGNFLCSNNELTDLFGGPIDGPKIYECSNNKITDISAVPSIVSKEFHAYNNQLSSLRGIGKSYLKLCPHVNFTDNPIKSHILGLLLIKDLETIEYDGGNQQYFEVLEQFLGSKDIMDAQEALFDNGFKEYGQI